jgi:hypothetical protein
MIPAEAGLYSVREKGARVAVEGSAILGMYPIRHRTLACLMVRPGQAGSEVACCDRAPPASAARGVGHLNGSWGGASGCYTAAVGAALAAVRYFWNRQRRAEHSVCVGYGRTAFGIAIEMTMPESNHSLRNRYRSCSDVAE